MLYPFSLRFATCLTCSTSGFRAFVAIPQNVTGTHSWSVSFLPTWNRTSDEHSKLTHHIERPRCHHSVPGRSLKLMKFYTNSIDELNYACYNWTEHYETQQRNIHHQNTYHTISSFRVLIVRVESEGRGDKIAVLRLACFFDSPMYSDDETSSFFP